MCEPYVGGEFSEKEVDSMAELEWTTVALVVVRTGKLAGASPTFVTLPRRDIVDDWCNANGSD
jgi:hypothetical protein